MDWIVAEPFFAPTIVRDMCRLKVVGYSAQAQTCRSAFDGRISESESEVSHTLHYSAFVQLNSDCHVIGTIYNNESERLGNLSTMCNVVAA